MDTFEMDTPNKKRKITKNTSSPPSNTCSSSTSPPAAAEWDYEVFLSFRGSDTRYNFTDTLYHDLVAAGIRTFRDNEELHAGEKIAELFKAIQHSKISIPVFSKDYASSKWCLKEIAEMVECRRTFGQLILPIFFLVEPSDVKKQTGCYKEAFQKHEEEVKKQEVKKVADVDPSDVRHQTGSYEEAFQKQKEMKESLAGWKKALREVGELKGWTVNNSTPQGKLIKEVVSEVWRELKRNSLVVTDCLVGIDDHVEKLMELLSVNSSDVRIVGIHGMGGIGKTTIAKVIYNQLSQQNFQSHCCFLEDVRATAQQQNGLVHLQKQLISDILKLSRPDLISTKDEGIYAIKEKFSRKKVLVVVDDADHSDQLRALALEGKCDWFGSGSRIIVTTRNKDILHLPEVGCRTYEPKELNFTRSLLLFSRYAFRRGHPPEDYDNLSKDVVSTTGGLPLALEVIGSFLSGKEKELWKGTLKKLEGIPNKAVQDKLKISYDALQSDQQHIFLDIACFLIGVDRRIAFHMWDVCKFFPESGIEVLINMSLVKIGNNNELRMHDQLRDLGRDIVRQENVEEPGKRSRVWFHEDAIDVLEGHAGTTKVKAISVNFELESQAEALTNENFANLSGLRFLQVDNAELDGDFTPLLLNLRWLRWNGCPQNFRPTTNFCLEKLVILDLSRSNMTAAWEGWNHIKKFARKTLKVLNLTCCKKMVSTPDFSAYETLERLILEDCGNLEHIDPSIGKLNSLVFLNVKYCAKLKSLPLGFDSVEAYNLTELLIDGTCIEEVPIGRGIMKKLETLSATNCWSLTQISTSIGHLTSLLNLTFDGSSGITKLPDSIGSLVKLQCLSLRYCKLKELPDSIGKLESLIELDLSYTCITELPDTIGNLNRLRILEMQSSLIVKLPSTIGMLLKLEELHASFCSNLEGEIPSNFGGLSSLRILRIDSTRICRLPTSIRGLSNLQTLDLSGCKNLEFVPDLPSSLVSLKVTCRSMEKFLDLHSLVNLKELEINECYMLLKIPEGIGALSRLTSLHVVNCKQLQCLPALPSSLMSLYVGICEQLQRLPALPSSLTSLTVLGFEQLQCLPALPSSLTSLKVLNCRQLRCLPALPSSLTSLEVQNCKQLRCLPALPSSLTSLEVEDCKQLRCLPTLPSSLTSLEVQNCKQLGCLPTFPSSLTSLEVQNCKQLGCLPTLPSSLTSLEVQNCKRLRCLPTLPSSLTYLEVQNCRQLKCLPTLPSSLASLYVYECTQLQCLPALPSSLTVLYVEECKSMKRLPDRSNLKNLSSLLVLRCSGLREIPCLGRLELLPELDLDGCESLETLPDLSNFKNVRILSTAYCKNLNEITGLDRLESLEDLDMRNCTSLERLPDLSKLEKLERLNLRCCEKIHEIEGLEALKSLKKLNLSWCTALEKAPDLSRLTNLEKLKLRRCEKLSEICGLEELKLLEFLDLSFCTALERIPDLSKLTKLRKLRLRNCEKLSKIWGLEKLKLLELLDLSFCTALERIPDLSRLTKLRKLRLRNCEKLSKIWGLEELELLQLDISGCKLLGKLPDLPNYEGDYDGDYECDYESDYETD